MVPIKTDGVKAFSCAMDIMIGDVLCFNNTEAKVVNISVRVLNDSYYDISLVEKDYNKQTFFLDGFEVHNCGFWTGKKRYGMKVWDNEGVRYKEPEYKIVGLDLVKTSIPADVRKHMKESVLMILNRGTKDSVVKYNNDYKTEFMKLPVEAISFPRGVNGIGKYSNSTTIYEKATPMQSRAALLYNHLVKKLKLESKYPMIKEGDKIKYCYLRMPNPLKENVIGFIDVLPPEFNLTKWADYTTMYDKGFMSQMNTIMDAIGWSTSTKGTLDW
jgi:DNA polymerase elongation subunit (family B)